MSAPRAAAATHFAIGGFTVLRALNGLLRPTELPQYSKVWNAFLFQYGGPLTGLVVGAALIAVGFITLRAKDPGLAAGELSFSNEAEIPLAPVMAGFLLLLGTGSVTAILPYTGERGVEPGQIASALALFPMLLVGVWFLLHHRRLTIFDTAARAVEVSYGKPWVLLRRRYPFANYQSLSIDVVPRNRVTVYRVVATGPNHGSKMFTFCFSETRAKECVADIARATGWTPVEGPAPT